MLQLAGLFAASWLLLGLFEKKRLAVLGLLPTTKRLKYFITLFIVSAAIATLAFLLRVYFVKEQYILNTTVNVKLILTETWHQIRTVLTEELICRGALLYILIKKAGQLKAILISAVIFAALHLTETSMWGNLPQMIMVLTFTFAMGLLLAYSYTRTLSLLMPFAIHFGWNLVQNFIFSGSTTGNHIFILSVPPPTVTISYLSFYTMLLLPKVAVIAVCYLILKQYKQEKTL